MSKKKKLSQNLKILIGVLSFSSLLLLLKKRTLATENFTPSIVNNIDSKYYSLIPSAIREQFKTEFVSMCNKLGIEPIWLLMVMYKESKLNAGAINPHNGASGLIQFVRATAKNLGTSLEKIRTLNAVQQLPLVYKYLLPYRNQLNSFEDVYCSVYLPLLLGKPMTYIIPSKYYKGNEGLDLDKNKLITKKEFLTWAHKNQLK